MHSCNDIFLNAEDNIWARRNFKNDLSGCPLAFSIETLLINVKWSCNIADFAAALANPIAYQSALEKHAEQLAVLEEDFDAPVRKSERGEYLFQTALSSLS